ncbi:hypothetical protein CDL12_24844 [Handroanthus impetiginosus]|uniref:SAWADEE domain-containing protein n=1 Tax=Handroanthus impetiginosus TaxID=429701 RepID=A0A2G9GBP8_9LAMI|nr:hypothetical protein CDL12_24844 [Handroanthus impetiginosus]
MKIKQVKVAKSGVNYKNCTNLSAESRFVPKISPIKRTKRKTLSLKSLSPPLCVCVCVCVCVRERERERERERAREMDDEFDAMEVENDLPEFTLAEIIEMENLYKKMREKPIAEELFQELSAKFNCSTHRVGKSLIRWEQVKRWFQNKQTNLTAKVNPSSAYGGAVVPKAAVVKKRVRVPTISSSEAAAVLPNLIFEARSAKDYAWFDVASFLTYRVLSSGELVVRVRFAGFNKEEDEWVSVKRAVRERSIPLEHSECDRVNVGDLVLCYREAEDDALYCDAHVLEIERKSHDSNDCTCIFVVRYDHDSFEEKVRLNKLCCRPTQSGSEGNEGWKTMLLEPIGM